MTPRSDQALAAEFGRRVRSLRTAAGLTQEQLAEALGAHRTFPGTIERGEAGATLTTICRLAAALGVDPGVLVEGLKPSRMPGTERPRGSRTK